PGMSFDKAVNTDEEDVQANIAVPEYFETYEEEFDLPVYRPLKVRAVCDRGDRLKVETDGPHFSARGIINATGTWVSLHLPDYPGKDRFKGRQLHTKDYETADEFKEQHVIIVGGGISAIQLLDEISRVTKTTWVTRRPPDFRERSLTREGGRSAVAIVEERGRNGQPPGSVVSLSGLPVSVCIKAMKKRGVLKRRPMFREITEEWVRWENGHILKADVILWCTGF